jgi:hypothetical protein
MNTRLLMADVLFDEAVTHSLVVLATKAKWKNTVRQGKGSYLTWLFETAKEGLV